MGGFREELELILMTSGENWSKYSVWYALLVGNCQIDGLPPYPLPRTQGPNRLLSSFLICGKSV